ncbi:hypothetical protein NDU88_010645 [Pleurodeles waltl]|uniref:Uncharacterized protein n=1 Tax=Pleurodeles waltl TaxID=8319 RepID=A0AAV7QWG7_PLEWA|nr:hypothetical protein NDU88_010645 [Pleurodeles waltl]
MLGAPRGVPVVRSPIGASIVRGRALPQGQRRVLFPRDAAPSSLRLWSRRVSPPPQQGPGSAPRYSPLLAGSNPCRRLRCCGAMALRGLPVPTGLRRSPVDQAQPALAGPSLHARSRLRAQRKAASLPHSRLSDLYTSRPERGPGCHQDRPPVPLLYSDAGLPGDGTPSLRIYISPSGARGLSVRHLRIVSHAPRKRMTP